MDTLRSKYAHSTGHRLMLPPPENPMPEKEGETQTAAMESMARASVHAFKEAHNMDLGSPGSITAKIVVVPMETDYTHEDWIGEPVLYESDELSLVPEDGHVAGDDVAYSVKCSMGFNSGTSIFPPRGIIKIFLKQGRASLPVMVGRYNLHAKWDSEDLRFCDIDEYLEHMQSKTKQTKRHRDDGDEVSTEKRERASNVSPGVKEGMAAIIHSATKDSVDTTKEYIDPVGGGSIFRALYGDEGDGFIVTDDMTDTNGGRIIMEGSAYCVNLRAWVRPFSAYQHMLASIAASHEMPILMRSMGFKNIPETGIESALHLLSVSDPGTGGSDETGASASQ